jgi:hypothetical protein
MDYFIALNNNFNTDIKYETDTFRGLISYQKHNYNPDNQSLTAEGGKNFFRYLKSLYLSGNSGLLVLSPNNHYFYDEDELKSVKTLVNLKKLNLIKDLDTFLYALVRILPADTNFIGCFADSETPDGNGFFMELSTRINNLLDAKTDQNLNRKSVTGLLEKYGFRVVDMTDINGLIFFCSKKISQPAEIVA